MPAIRYRGTATWYCSATSTCTKGYDPGDLVAAIDSDLGFRKGDRITVRAFGRAVTVTIVDVCACAGERLVDLTRGAFARLADPALGVIPVTVELAAEGIPLAPSTDVAHG
jgi:rare lipoprotein A (peptidoglycan hydrolase)